MDSSDDRRLHGRSRLSREPRLEGKVAVITGASRGIGQAIAVRFVEDGARVALIDLEPCTETVDLICGIDGVGLDKLPTLVMAVKGDVSCEDDLRQAAQEIKLWSGVGVHILVNNAVRFNFHSVESAAKEHWEEVHRVNVIGGALTTKQIIPLMKESGTGSIVFMGSISSFLAQPNCATYASTKAAVVQMARSCAYDLAKYNIRANAVCPGTIETPIQEMERQNHGWTKEEQREVKTRDVMLRRLGTTREVANAVLYFASDESSYCTGSSLLVDGGSLACTVMPDD